MGAGREKTGAGAGMNNNNTVPNPPPCRRVRRSGVRGFTLLELLVVIAIIGLLATIALAALSPARQHARDLRSITDLQTIAKALELFYDTRETYPNFPGVVLTTLPVLPGDPTDWNNLKVQLAAYLPLFPRPNFNEAVYQYVGSSVRVLGPSQCLRIVDGYYLQTRLRNPNHPLNRDDGGVLPDVYEVFNGSSVGIYPNASCPLL